MRPVRRRCHASWEGYLKPTLTLLSSLILFMLLAGCAATRPPGDGRNTDQDYYSLINRSDFFRLREKYLDVTAIDGDTDIIIRALFAHLYRNYALSQSILEYLSDNYYENVGNEYINIVNNIKTFNYVRLNDYENASIYIDRHNKTYKRDFIREINNFDKNKYISNNIDETYIIYADYDINNIPILNAKIGNATFPFILATGATHTGMGLSHVEAGLLKQALKASTFAGPVYLTPVDGIDFGGQIFANVILLAFERGIFSDDIKGALGMQEILRFDTLQLYVEGGQIARISLGPPERREASLAPNLLLFDTKPILEVRIANEIYSCLLNTGAPTSLFAKPIIDKIPGRKSGATDILFEAGHALIDLKNVIGMSTYPHENFCVLGIDAVIAAGGLSLDFVALDARFGPLQSPAIAP